MSDCVSSHIATKSRIALTFESGGDPDVSSRMLDILRENDVPATIFVLGKWAETNPELVQRMVVEGHALGNHSYSHPDLTQLREDEIREELRRTDVLVTQLAGQRAFPWLRPPYGAVDDALRRVAIEDGYRLVMRDAVDGGHWPGTTNEAAIIKRTIDHAYDGAVITYHINNPLTLRVLAEIIHRLKSDHHHFVCLSDLPEVSEYAERHAASQEVEFASAFLQVMRPGVRVWSMDSIEYGTRKTVPTKKLIQLAETNNGAIYLLSCINTKDVFRLPPGDTDRYFVHMSGAAECLIIEPDTGQTSIRLITGAGYTALWPRFTELSIQAVSQNCLFLVIE